MYIVLLLLPTWGWAQTGSKTDWPIASRGKYTGEVVAGKPEGQAPAVYPNGNKYGGGFVNDQRNNTNTPTPLPMARCRRELG